MLPLIVAVVCGLTIWHFQRHSIGTAKLVLACLVPVAFSLAFGFLGMMIGVLYTGAMVRLDLGWA